MEARNRLIKDWFARIRARQLVLPRFQRFESWGPHEITALLTSVIRGLPVGATLILEVGEKIPFNWRPIIGAPEEGERITELLLDGQQRLTALWRSMKDNYTDKTYLVELEPSDEDGKAPRVIAQTRWFKNGKKYPLWVDDPRECWKRKLIPVKLLDPDNETEYQTWADEASEGDHKVAREIERIITKLRERVANFNLPYLYLHPETPPDVAIDVFIKLNTNVAPLKPFDIIVAQMEEEVGESLHELVSTLKKEVPRIEEYTEPSTFVLSVAALLQDKLPNQRGYFQIDFSKFLEDWKKMVKGTNLLVQFLEEEGVVNRQVLPTESVLPPLAALWADAPTTSDEAGNVRIILRKYLWRAFFTERYDRAVPIAILQDYRALKKILNGEKVNVPCFDEDKYPLPTFEQLKQARWPKYRDRLGRAILLLSLRGGAEDIADGSKISKENISFREYHHLYPIAWLKGKGRSENEANIALNCILVTWKTNRKISSKDPLNYLKERCEASSLGEDEIKRRLKTHFVDFDTLASNDFDKFIEQRAKDAGKALKELCEGKRWYP